MDWDYSGRKETFVSCRILTEKTNAPIKLFNQQENPFEKHINISAYIGKIAVPKGQLVSKGLFMSLFQPKNQRNFFKGILP